MVARRAKHSVWRHGDMETSRSTSWTPTGPTAGGFSTASTSGSRRGRLMGRGSSSVVIPTCMWQTPTGLGCDVWSATDSIQRGLHRSLCLALHRLPLRLASPVVRVFDLQPAAIVLAIEARVFLARTGRLRRPLHPALHVVEHFRGRSAEVFQPFPTSSRVANRVAPLRNEGHNADVVGQPEVEDKASRRIDSKEPLRRRPAI